MSLFMSPLKTTGPTARDTACAIVALWGLAAPTAPLAQPASDLAATEAVVITAARQPQPLARVLADMSVLERADIERSGATALADLLGRLPGIQFARNGGPGSVTSVFIRGGENRHVAVYIDGLRVDSQSTGGAPWEALPLDEVERIEVLRGPAAALYGSDAVAGVVQLFTRRGSAGRQLSAALSVGTHETVAVRAGVSGASGAVDYALSLSQGRSQGFNARTTVTAPPDADGWRRGGLQGRLGLALAPGQRLEAALLASNLRSQYDGFGTADDRSRYAVRQAGLTWQGDWSGQSTTRVQLGETRNTYENKPDFYRTETTQRHLVLQQTRQFGGQQFRLTLERREDGLRNPATAWTPTLQGRRHQNALALGWQVDFGAHALQAHLRHDRDSEFGGQNTASLGWGMGLAHGWRATASAASSFRAPTLYQRFSEYGVAALRPETGRHLELGLRWAQAGSSFSATAFRNRVGQLINFGAAGACASAFGCYENVGRAGYDGVTLAGSRRLGALALRGSVDWHDPRNLDNGQLLARRARQFMTLGADLDWAGWRLGAEGQASGHRVEYDFLGNASRLGGFGLLNLRAERPLGQGLVLDARIDNASDKAYETARTYATAGRTVQLALRWVIR
jgi:vitamin B12 transporter